MSREGAEYDKEQLRELGETQLGQKEAQGDSSLEYLKGGWSQVLSSQAAVTG